MIRCALPEALLLVPLAALLLRRRLWPDATVGALRVLLLVLVAAVLARPWRPGLADGRDVVLVLDRSRSMPAAAEAEARELAAQVAGRLQPGDRLGLVTFGRKAAVELVPQAPFGWPGFARAVDPDGSDLAAGVAAGLSLIAPGRHGSLLVVADGQHTGGDLEAAARAALRAGVRIDVQPVGRAIGGDCAVADLLAPSEAAVGEPFAVDAVVVAPAAGPARYRLFADGALVREGTADLVAGRNVLQFRRALASAAVQQLAIEVSVAGDPLPQNDRALAVVRGVAAPRVLCVTPGGRAGRLVGSLKALGLDVTAAAPAAAPLAPHDLDGFRCVVLENVPAGELPPGALAALATFVRDLGGGLLMTGGKAGFGVGGWHKSPVEDVLPVTMELRDEQRRYGLAMAIALDRSGSMTARVGDATKMELADAGAATAVELLSAIDAVAVIAVDSEAHVIVPMQPVADRAGIAEQVRRIESAGGGIYVGEALHAAAEQLAASRQQNRHIVLFADAADAEEPLDYQTFVPELARAGVTVSVIGLGSDTDSDAGLLQEIARLGNGRITFVADAADLPRVFAQETIQVAKAAMVEQPTAVEVLPALATLGDLPAAFPRLGGYSLAWARPRAELDLRSLDEQRAPLLAHWQCGLGRAAAFLGEADGEFSGELAQWDRYGDCFGTLVRWLCGGQARGVFVDAHREGAVGIVSVEVEDELASQLDTVRGVLSAPGGRTSDLVFERLGPARLQARVPLDGEGIFRLALQIAGTTVRMPPLALPYSPEFAPEPDPRAGERTLRRLATTTGGRLLPTADQVLEGERRSAGHEDLARLCALLALAVLLAEIVVRRFGLRVPAVRWRRAVAPSAPPAATAPTAPVARAPEPATPPAPPPDPASPLLDALARAKKRTRR